jgi:hypothetical protein
VEARLPIAKGLRYTEKAKEVMVLHYYGKVIAKGMSDEFKEAIKASRNLKGNDLIK